MTFVSLEAKYIFLNTPFSNTLTLYPSLNVSEQVPHSFKTADKFIIFYTCIFIFLDNKLEDRGPR